MTELLYPSAILLRGDNKCYLTIPLNSPLLLFHKGFPLILHWLVNYLGMVLCNIDSKAMDHIMELWKYWFQVPLNQNHLKIQIKHVKSIWYYPLKWQQHFKYLLFHQITFIWTGFPLIPIVSLNLWLWKSTDVVLTAWIISSHGGFGRGGGAVTPV